MGTPDNLTCLLRNLYAGQEATVRTGLGTTDWFQIGKGVRQGCILSPCLFNRSEEHTSELQSQVGMVRLRNLYAGLEATVRTGLGTTDWFQIGKGVCQGCHLAYLTSIQSTS